MLSEADVKLIHDAAALFLRVGSHTTAGIILEALDGIKQFGPMDKLLARQAAIAKSIAERRQVEKVTTRSPMIYGDPRELLDPPIQLELAEEECRASHELGENGAG